MTSDHKILHFAPIDTVRKGVGMGRSQVLYNRTHGRVGRKGRGGGSREKTRSTPNDVGTNAWRYELSTESSSREDALEQRLMALESHGNYSNKVSAVEVSYHHHSSDLNLSLNAHQMANTLKSASWSSILRLPPHLTASIERPVVSTKASMDITKVTHEDASRAADTPVQEEEHDEDDLDSWLDSVIA